MTEKTITPADIIAEADAVSKQADADMATEAEQAAVDATDLARQMAVDYEIDITKINGTGKEGRVTVPDVDKHHKALILEEAEKEIVPDEPVEEAEPEPKPEPEKPKVAKTLVAGSILPNVIVGLEEIYHIVRTLSERGMGWQSSQVSVEDADDELSKLLTAGWEIIKTQPLGYSQDGVEIIWVLGKFTEGKVERYPYSEIHHITRRIGGLGDDGRGISGTAANALISGYLQSGWDLAMCEALDQATGGSVNVMWILVR